LKYNIPPRGDDFLNPHQPTKSKLLSMHPLVSPTTVRRAPSECPRRFHLVCDHFSCQRHRWRCSYVTTLPTRTTKNHLT